MLSAAVSSTQPCVVLFFCVLHTSHAEARSADRCAMTLAQQVLALRQFFGTPPDAPLSVAIEMMNVVVDDDCLVPHSIPAPAKRWGG